MAELAAIGTIVSGLSTVAGGLAARNQANAEAEATQKKAAWDAEMARRKGAEEMAAAQQRAGEERRRKEYVISEQRAKAASSGAGVSNPTVLDLIGDVEKEGEFRAKTETQTGKARQAGLMDQANLSLWEGKTSASAAKSRGKSAFIGSLLEGAGDIAQGVYKYKMSRYG